MGNLPQEPDPPAAATLQPRHPWWALNWHLVAPWAAALAAFLIGMGSLFLMTTGLLQATHESYRQALVSWEASLREDVRALRNDIQAEVAGLRSEVADLRSEMADLRSEVGGPARQRSEAE